MYKNYVFEDISEALFHLMADVHDQGASVGSRGGSTKELTHVGITLRHPWRREILVPERKANLAAQIAETMWVLAGRNDVEFLSHYLPRAEQFSDDGEVWRGGYGPRLRSWTDDTETHKVDQLAEVVRLLKEDLGTRRAVMSIFDPMWDFQDSKDIPCNNWLSFLYRDGKLDLHVAIRSNDLMWGWSGINAFEWSSLLEIVAGLVGVDVGSLHFSITSLHLYEQHWGKALDIAGSAWLSVPGEPTFDISSIVTDNPVHAFDELVKEWFKIEEAIRTGGPTQMHTTVAIDNFPEPMLRGWLRVLQWWWYGDFRALEREDSLRLERAARVALQPPDRNPTILEFKQDGSAVFHGNLKAEDLQQAHGVVLEESELSPFLQYVLPLHREKEAAYGGSWKRRGEMLGIMANIARKVDRLGGGETADETSADTAIDLMVYLAKYYTWLQDHGVLDQKVPERAGRSDDPEYANRFLVDIERAYGRRNLSTIDVPELIEHLEVSFDDLETLVMGHMPERMLQVHAMTEEAYLLAAKMWNQERWRQSNSTRVWNPEQDEVDHEMSAPRVVRDEPQA